MAEESGASLRAVGWRMESRIPPSIWNQMSRAHAYAHDSGPRARWAAFASEASSTADAMDLHTAFFPGEAAGRSGAVIGSNPFNPGDESERWAIWRETI